MKFEWDPKKAEANLAKHAVSFEDASTVFGDALAGTIPAPLHSAEEARFVTIGHSGSGKLLVVVHADRGERARIISARVATSAERRRDESKTPIKNDDDMLPEYDFSHAVRGKYYEQYRQGTNVVLLDEDVADVFRSATAVNEALRSLIAVADANVSRRQPPTRRSTKARKPASRARGKAKIGVR